MYAFNMRNKQNANKLTMFLLFESYAYVVVYIIMLLMEENSEFDQNSSAIKQDQRLKNSKRLVFRGQK